MKQKSFDEEMKQLFGGKVYRLCLSSAVTCPNRDGRISTGGCIFCSEGGSGEFAAASSLPIEIQLAMAKKKVASKLSKNFAGYMAYFQSFSSTYAPLDSLRVVFEGAIADPEVLALSVATRPDCLPAEVLDLLSELNRKKPVWVELGLQSMHEDTARLINRGYSLTVFEQAVLALRKRGIRVVVHTIIGLPGETKERTLETFRYLRDFSCGVLPQSEHAVFKEDLAGTDGPSVHTIPQKPLINAVKLQQLSILRGTKLADCLENISCPKAFEAASGPDNATHNGSLPYNQTGLESTFHPAYSLEEYASVLKEILAILPEEMSIHRLTCDPPKALLLAPLWCADKKKTMNYLREALRTS